MRRGAAPRLRVLGCGEAFDSGLGNNACVLYEGCDGVVTRKPRLPTLLFDCGYQVPERLWQLPKLYPRIDGIYFTHLHADHAFGVVPVLVRFWEERRQAPLRLIGPRGLESYVRKALDLGYPGMRARLTFELQFAELREGDSMHWRGLRLRCARSQHSVLNLAVRVEGEGDGVGISFGISGDGQLTEATRELFRDVGLLLQETYTREPKIPGHGDLKTLSIFASESAIKRLGITHISRTEKSRVQTMLKQLGRREPGRWVGLEPGMEIELIHGHPGRR